MIEGIMRVDFEIWLKSHDEFKNDTEPSTSASQNMFLTPELIFCGGRSKKRPAKPLACYLDFEINTYANRDTFDGLGRDWHSGLNARFAMLRNAL